MLARPAVAVVLAATPSATALPAHAGTRVVPDRGGADDTRVTTRFHPYGEIRALRLRYGRGRLTVRIVSTRRSEGADVDDVYVDVNGDGRPDRRITYDQGYGPPRSARVLGVRQFSPFPDRSARLACARVPVTLGRRGSSGRPITLRVPGRCLGRPASLRVSAVTSMEYGRADRAPGFRAFGRPVRRG